MSCVYFECIIELPNTDARDNLAAYLTRLAKAEPPIDGDERYEEALEHLDFQGRPTIEGELRLSVGAEGSAYMAEDYGQALMSIGTSLLYVAMDCEMEIFFFRWRRSKKMEKFFDSDEQYDEILEPDIAYGGDEYEERHSSLARRDLIDQLKWFVRQVERGKIMS